MKTRMMTFALLLLLAGGAMSGCDADYHDYGDDGVEMLTDQFTVQASHWEWNERYGRLEYIRDWSEIDRYMYEQGAVTAGVFVQETDGRGTYEVLRSLPFVHTYTDQLGTYTQTIGYDISYSGNRRYIAFYIQNSDLSVPAKDNYTFKTSLFWHK